MNWSHYANYLLVVSVLATVQAAGAADPRARDPERRVIIGLCGYPNVGASHLLGVV